MSFTLLTLFETAVRGRPDGALLQAALPRPRPLLRRRLDLHAHVCRKGIHPPPARSLLGPVHQRRRPSAHRAVRSQGPRHVGTGCRDDLPVCRRRGLELWVSADVGLSGGHWGGINDESRGREGDGRCSQTASRHRVLCQYQDPNTCRFNVFAVILMGCLLQEDGRVCAASGKCGRRFHHRSWTTEESTVEYAAKLGCHRTC
jgi:hypothetical protein